ncbi:MAG TPA: hypothetical protein VLM79_31900 [Kofleriaceae bacterium]|nr:hypothetical protein [Kofleriaceae bacterium]
MQPTTRGRFGELLVSAGLVNEAQITVAKASYPDARIASALILAGAIAPEVVNRALAQQHGLTPLKLSALDHSDPDAHALVPAHLARRLRAVAIAVMNTDAGRTLLVAMRDPGDLSAIDELTFAAGMKIDARVVPDIYLQAALERDSGPAPASAAPASPAPVSAAPASAAPEVGTSGAVSEPASVLRSRMPSIRPAGGTAPAIATIPIGTDPYAPSVVGRVLGYALKAAVLAALIAACIYGYRTCFQGNTRPVGTHYASKSLDLTIDFPDVGWRIAPAVAKKIRSARAEYFYRGNAPEFPIVGMVLVRSTNSATGLHAAASAAEALLNTIIHNPRLRGCEPSDARPDAVMCVTTGVLELFGMVKGVVAVVEVHAWAMGPDVIAAAMIQPDKTTTETKQILTSIAPR